MQNVVTVPTIPSPQRPFFQNKFSPGGYQKSPGYFQNNQQFRQQANAAQAIEFDGKRLRKAVARKTVDYNASIVKYLETRTWQRDDRDRRALQPDVGYASELMPPMSYLENPVNAITTKFVRTSTNKMRCPIFCVVWTPEGRRLITGASSGEFTLWNGLTFNFETILQAHDSPVRCMVWSHNDIWMVTGDHSGYVKYWQSNMNNVKMFQAHKEPLRGLSFCPTDTKFVTCSDDGTVRIWDFLRCHEEKILRGHGADVKCVAWHPQKSLIVSGSKDSQQPIKLWDPKSGQSLATLHAHKSTVMEVKWNQNGTWMLTASRDHLLKLFDIRNMSQEVQTFRGHKKEACSISWHPIHESMFVSGGSDGSVMFWVVGADKEVGSMEQAHDSCVWSLGWHPLGHILCTGSNDHTSKFWTRNRPGDRMRDKYNLNTLPRGQDETAEYDEPSSGGVIPGMGLDVFGDENDDPDFAPAIPGLDFGSEEGLKNGNATVNLNTPSTTQNRKVPFSKPIPRQFQQQWMENKQPLLLAPPPSGGTDMNQQAQAGIQPMMPQQPSMGSLMPGGPHQSQMGNMGPPQNIQGPLGSNIQAPIVTNMQGPMGTNIQTSMGSNLQGSMGPNMQGNMLPNMQGNMLPNMQSTPNNPMLMGDMSSMVPSHNISSDFSTNPQMGGSISNFPINQQVTPMLQQNISQFGPRPPAPNMFIQSRPQLDQQKSNELFGARDSQMMHQRSALLGSRPKQMQGGNLENVSQSERSAGNLNTMSATSSTMGEIRTSSSQLNMKQQEDRDWKNFADFDDRNASGKDDLRSSSKDITQSPSSSGGGGQSSSHNIPPFTFMPHQNQPFLQQSQHQNMMQTEQRFGRDDFEDRASSQSNFNRNMNIQGRGNMSNQQQNFLQHNQFGGNSYQDNEMRFMSNRMGGGPDGSRMGSGPDNSRMLGGPDRSDSSRVGGSDGVLNSGNNDYSESGPDKMRKRQWEDGPGDMGGPMPQGGGHWKQQQGFQNRGGRGGARGFMRGGRGPQRGGQGNRPFRGNFRGNRGNMRGNSNF